MPDFRTWVKEQSQRDDAVGGVCREILEHYRKKCCKARTIDGMYRHLMYYHIGGASVKMISAFDEARAEFEARAS